MPLQRIAFLLFSEFQILDVSGPLQVFASANALLREQGRPPHYQTMLLAREAGAVASSSGMQVQAGQAGERLRRRLHTLFIPGGNALWSADARAQMSEIRHLVKWTQSAQTQVKRLASVCTGAFVLAQAGILDGRQAVAHWAACDELQRQFPAVRVERNAIFFRDGHIWTSAGVTAGIDMAMSMVEHDLGSEIAMAIARILVMFYRRPGGQSQFSSPLLSQCAEDERVASLHAWMGDHLECRINVPQMAEFLAMSTRTFTRFYRARSGRTPAQALAQLRLERACAMIESRAPSMKEVARKCGFPSEEIMRRTFLRHLHISPSRYRERFSSPPTMR